MKFVEGFPYLIEEDFECEDFLSKNYDSIVRYFERKKERIVTLDVPLLNTPLNLYFTPKIKDIINNLFITNSPQMDIRYNLYIQNNTQPEFSYHNHIHLPFSICGVFYTKIPKIGGEFKIIHFPYITPHNPIIFKPQKNKIYLFPSWLYHSPTTQEDEEKRICININVTYPSCSRPIIKDYEQMW